MNLQKNPVDIKSLIDNVDVTYLGKNLYEIVLKQTGNRYINQTGSNVALTFKFPFAHRLVRVELKHTDSSDADSTDALTWSLKRAFPDGLWLSIIAFTGSTVTDFFETDDLGEQAEFPNMEYQLNTNTTNTDRCRVIMTIQLLRKWDQRD